MFSCGTFTVRYMYLKSDRRVLLEMKPRPRFLMVAGLALLLSWSACVIAVVTGAQPDVAEVATVLFEVHKSSTNYCLSVVFDFVL